MSEIDWVELMEEIPGGANHGRSKDSVGGWVDLATDEWLPGSPATAPTPTSIIHGTLTGYAKRGCRCPECRKAMAQWRKARRLRMSNY